MAEMLKDHRFPCRGQPGEYNQLVCRGMPRLCHVPVSLKEILPCTTSSLLLCDLNERRDIEGLCIWTPDEERENILHIHPLVIILIEWGYIKPLLRVVIKMRFRWKGGYIQRMDVVQHSPPNSRAQTSEEKPFPTTSRMTPHHKTV